MTSCVRPLASVCVVAALACASFAQGAPAPAPDEKQVRAAALLLQIVASVEESVTSGELGQVHNEDEFLYSVLAFLSQSGTPEQRSRLDVLIPALGRSVSDLHQAADTFDRDAARERLPAVKRAFDDVIAVYDAATVDAARSLARREVAMYLDVIAELDPTVQLPPELIPTIRERIRDGRDDAGEIIPDDVLDLFAFAGDPDDIAAQAQGLIDAGVDRIEFGTPHGADEAEGIRLLGREVLPRLSPARRPAPGR